MKWVAFILVALAVSAGPASAGVYRTAPSADVLAAVLVRLGL